MYSPYRMKTLGISASCVQVNPPSNFPSCCKLSTRDDHTPVRVLIDSGASGDFISQTLVNNLQLTTE